MGRDRTSAPAKGPRIVDLDMLLLGDVAMATPELTLPHPAMHERRFVLEPLAEIAPTMVHPPERRAASRYSWRSMPAAAGRTSTTSSRRAQPVLLSVMLCFPTGSALASAGECPM